MPDGKIYWYLSRTAPAQIVDSTKRLQKLCIVLHDNELKVGELTYNLVRYYAGVQKKCLSEKKTAVLLHTSLKSSPVRILLELSVFKFFNIIDI